MSVEETKDKLYDLLIIGGGITGAGIALDAVSRGLDTVLVEKNDFASGTSSKSTKLIHGGLRYLKQFEIALVREVGRERAIVHRLAPQLVKSEKMMLPIIKGGSFGKILTSVGLMVYDVLAGVEKADQRKMLDKEETLKKEPLLPEEIVEGGGLYAEYRTDDARLTIEVIKTSTQFGAKCINYMEVEDFIYENNSVIGTKCVDYITNEKSNIKARYIVNAAGPWVDELRQKNKSKQGKSLHLTKGVHIVVPHEKLPVSQAIYFDVPDGRMIFAIPRGRVTYIGTTDTDYHGDKNQVITENKDAEYLVDAVNNTFRTVNLKVEDVVSSWAGLRPLIYEEGKSASTLSRKDEIFESKTGLISIAGGKLTGYRKMAERVLDMVVKKYKNEYGKSFEDCSTDEISLAGGKFNGQNEVVDYTESIKKQLNKLDLDTYYAEYLVNNYGNQTNVILEKINDFDDEDPEIKLGRAELWYVVNSEMVFNSLDYFARRTGRLYFEIDTIEKLKEPILNDLKDYFNWDSAKYKYEMAALEEAIYLASEVFK